MIKLNYATPINTLSLGLVGTNWLRELYKQGSYHISLFPIGPKQPPFDSDIVSDCVQNANTYKSDADSISLRFYHQFDLFSHIGKGPHIGATVFEKTLLTDFERQQLNNQDHIVVPTKWAKEILLENKVIAPISIVHYGVDRSIFSETLPNTELNRTSTIFGSYGKIEKRKSHDILVDAFCKAFEPSDDVMLHMYWNNPFLNENQKQDWTNKYKSSKMGKCGRIFVHHERMHSHKQVAQTMANIDCGIQISRAEGWDLEALELMSVGKPVIATYNTGHTEFCDSDTSLLIFPSESEVMEDGFWFDGSGGTWMKWNEDAIEQLVCHLRSIHRKKQTKGKLDLNVKGIEKATQLSWENSGKELGGIIDRV